MLTYLNPRRGLALLTFGVIAIALGMAFPLARTDSQLVAQQALPDEVLFTTNIIFDHSAPTQNPGSPPEIQPFYQDSDGIDLGRWIAKDLHHKGGGVDLKHDADSGEYVWKCPVASGGVLPQRSGSPSRNEPALYDVEKFASTVIHVRFQWPVVGSWEGIKEAEIWAEPIASPLPPPSGYTVWPPMPKLVLSETKADGTAHVKVEFEKKDHATAAGVSKGISLPGGYLKFKPEAGYTIPAAMWRFVDVKWQWKAKDIVYHGNGGGPAQMDFDVSGPHRIYMTRKAPRAPWVNNPVKKDNPSIKALDFLFDKCEVQGKSTFDQIGNGIATYLHSSSGHGLQYDHVYGAAGYTRQRSGGFVLPPGAPSNAPLGMFAIAGTSTTGVVEFNIDAFIDKSGFGKRPSDERLGPRPGGGEWPERDSNHVACYDCAAAMTAFLSLCGADAQYRHMQPFGYLNTLAFCATGTACNNPYFNRPGIVPSPVVGNDDLVSQLTPDGLVKRTAFGNHAFSSIPASGSETRLYDWNAGPALYRDVSGYISDTIDKSLVPDEVEISRSWPSPPPAIPGSVTNWNQPIAGTASHITTPGKFLIRINEFRSTVFED